MHAWAWEEGFTAFAVSLGPVEAPESSLNVTLLIAKNGITRTVSKGDTLIVVDRHAEASASSVACPRVVSIACLRAHTNSFAFHDLPGANLSKTISAPISFPLNYVPSPNPNCQFAVGIPFTCIILPSKPSHIQPPQPPKAWEVLCTNHSLGKPPRLGHSTRKHTAHGYYTCMALTVSLVYTCVCALGVSRYFNRMRQLTCLSPRLWHNTINHPIPSRPITNAMGAQTLTLFPTDNYASDPLSCKPTTA